MLTPHYLLTHVLTKKKQLNKTIDILIKVVVFKKNQSSISLKFVLKYFKEIWYVLLYVSAILKQAILQELAMFCWQTISIVYIDIISTIEHHHKERTCTM